MRSKALGRGGAGRSCAVAVLARSPVPGRTRTPLVPPLTPEEAAALGTAFLMDAADKLLRASSDAEILPFVAYGRGGSEAFLRSVLPPGVELIETGQTDVGELLFETARGLLRSGHGAVCLIDSESPTLPVRYLVEAVRVLAMPGDRVVLGPCTDGGCYLLGLNVPHRRLFEDIAWSTDAVVDQMMLRADEIDLPVHVLPVWYEVDDLLGLRRLVSELLDEAGDVAHATYLRGAEATTALLRQLRVGAGLADRLDRATPGGSIGRTGRA